MTRLLRELPRSAWREIVVWGATIIAGCVVVSVVLSYVMLRAQGQALDSHALTQAVVMPLILGTPILFYLLVRQQELKHAYSRLDIVASTDSLTGTLNRRAFTASATSLLNNTIGALLVVDADHFKRINDRFGHDAGDLALRKLADALRASVRKGDLVGRLGGEEFGVLLCDAGYDVASAIAERIRAAVGAIIFAPDGVACPISVSIGGAVASDRVRFTELFRLADRELYAAKRDGRNRVSITTLNGNALAAA